MIQVRASSWMISMGCFPELFEQGIHRHCLQRPDCSFAWHIGTNTKDSSKLQLQLEFNLAFHRAVHMWEPNPINTPFHVHHHRAKTPEYYRKSPAFYPATNADTHSAVILFLLKLTLAFRYTNCVHMPTPFPTLLVPIPGNTIDIIDFPNKLRTKYLSTMSHWDPTEFGVPRPISILPLSWNVREAPPSASPPLALRFIWIWGWFERGFFSGSLASSRVSCCVWFLR